MADQQERRKGHPVSPAQPRCNHCRQLMGLADLHNLCFKCRHKHGQEFRCDGQNTRCKDCARWSNSQRVAFAHLYHKKLRKAIEAFMLQGILASRDATGHRSPLSSPPPPPPSGSSHQGHVDKPSSSRKHKEHRSPKEKDRHSSHSKTHSGDKPRSRSPPHEPTRKLISPALSRRTNLRAPSLRASIRAQRVTHAVPCSRSQGRPWIPHHSR